MVPLPIKPLETASEYVDSEPPLPAPPPLEPDPPVATEVDENEAVTFRPPVIATVQSTPGKQAPNQPSNLLFAPGTAFRVISGLPE